MMTSNEIFNIVVSELKRYGFTIYKEDEYNRKIDFIYQDSLDTRAEKYNLVEGYTLRLERNIKLIKPNSTAYSLSVMGWILSSGHCVEYYPINNEWTSEKLKLKIKEIVDKFMYI